MKNSILAFIGVVMVCISVYAINCVNCGGNGFIQKVCFICQGSGYTAVNQRCFKCGGTGAIMEKCFMCNGTGDAPGTGSNQ